LISVTFKRNLFLPLIISLLAVFSSIYISEILMLPPCDLCWYQRILLFPMPLLIIVSIFKNDLTIKYYLRSLALIGIGIASYHYIIQFVHVESTFCGLESNCSSVQLEFLGFITIPFLSLITFIIIFISTVFIKNNN
jgi:disulfide bond formation protein DsbB